MRILIVDDSRVMRQIVQRALRQAGFTGYEVLEAADGRQAWALLGREDVDLVLCDWNMPDMDGLALLARVRGAELRLTFGFVTSEGSAAMRHLAEQAGADFLVAKPFTIESFRDALADVLGGARVQG